MSMRFATSARAKVLLSRDPPTKRSFGVFVHPREGSRGISAACRSSSRLRALCCSPCWSAFLCTVPGECQRDWPANHEPERRPFCGDGSPSRSVQLPSSRLPFCHPGPVGCHRAGDRRRCWSRCGRACSSRLHDADVEWGNHPAGRAPRRSRSSLQPHRILRPPCPVLGRAARQTVASTQQRCGADDELRWANPLL